VLTVVLVSALLGPTTKAFSFHLFAKRPIESVQTLMDYRRSVMKRIAILALQVSRSDAPSAPPPPRFLLESSLSFITGPAALRLIPPPPSCVAHRSA
jgi:hypothetical protein